MNKLTILLSIGILIIFLTSCDPIPGFSRDSGSSTPPQESSSGVSGVETLEDGRETNGYADGRIGDAMETQWFTFTVNSVEVTPDYNGIKAESNNFLLISSITIKNTYGDTLPMSQYDFQIQWGSGDSDFGYGLVESEMPTEFTLKRGESITQEIVFEIPFENDGEFSISFLEVYEDGEYGNVFFVYFEEDILDLASVDSEPTL